jgi:hypothetical protein
VEGGVGGKQHPSLCRNWIVKASPMRLKINLCVVEEAHSSGDEHIHMYWTPDGGSLRNYTTKYDTPKVMLSTTSTSLEQNERIESI